MSLGMMVTLLAWMAQRLVSSKRPTRYASAASWRAATALLWNLRSVLKSWAISLTSLWNGSFLIKSSVLFWYFLISLSATVPGLNLWGFFTPPVAGADFRAALVASCFLGAFPPVDFLAVCLVRAISLFSKSEIGMRLYRCRTMEHLVEEGCICSGEWCARAGALKFVVLEGRYWPLD